MAAVSLCTHTLILPCTHTCTAKDKRESVLAVSAVNMQIYILSVDMIAHITHQIMQFKKVAVTHTLVYLLNYSYIDTNLAIVLKRCQS